MKNIDSKLEKLRESKKDWDDQALDQIGGWEKGINRLILEEDYANLQLTKEIVDALTENVKRINRKLITEAEIPVPEKARLMGDKDRCLWLIRLIVKDYDAALAQIEKDIDFELEGL